MNTEALTRLVVLLRKPLPKGVTFNLRKWKGNVTCGTTACAVGLAAQDPWFRAQGLKLELVSGMYCLVWNGKGGYATSLRASDLCFDITRQATEHLFLRFSYPNGDRTTRYSVARRIKAFIKSEGLIPFEATKI